jgi:hypothetical protein
MNAAGKGTLCCMAGGKNMKDQRRDRAAGGRQPDKQLKCWMVCIEERLNTQAAVSAHPWNTYEVFLRKWSRYSRRRAEGVPE